MPAPLLHVGWLQFSITLFLPVIPVAVSLVAGATATVMLSDLLLLSSYHFAHKFAFVHATGWLFFSYIYFLTQPPLLHCECHRAGTILEILAIWNCCLYSTVDCFWKRKAQFSGVIWPTLSLPHNIICQSLTDISGTCHQLVCALRPTP